MQGSNQIKKLSSQWMVCRGRFSRYKEMPVCVANQCELNLHTSLLLLRISPDTEMTLEAFLAVLWEAPGRVHSIQCLCCVCCQGVWGLAGSPGVIPQGQSMCGCASNLQGVLMAVILNGPEKGTGEVAEFL